MHATANKPTQLALSTSHATSNWITLEYGATDPTLKYLQEHGTDEFLVKVDQGYGAGIEHKVMSGAHVYAALRYRMRCTIHAFARIYTEEELAQAHERMRAHA